jgi:uncharacterized MnhB-related membrane protein
MLATLVPLQSAAIVLVAIGSLAVVATREPLRMLIVNGLYGWLLVLLFIVYGAPDVALSALVVMTVAYPLVVLVAIARVRSRKKNGK